MKLAELIKDIRDLKIQNFKDVEITGLTDNSAEVKKGSLFGAFKGLKTDGIKFAEDAITKGASAILTHQDLNTEDIPVLISEREREIFSILVKKFYKNIDERMNLIGITGTNGKTSVAFILEAILKKLLISVGVIGTINYRWKNEKIKAKLTTPQAHTIFELLKKMYNDGVRIAILEVSSHAIDTKRVSSLKFKYGVFTNLSGDHLDYHKTMENYFSVKKSFIKKICDEGGLCFVNGDDEYGKRILNDLKDCSVSFGFSPFNKIKVVNYSLKRSGTNIEINYNNKNFNISTNLIGKTNIYNILPVIGILSNLGFTSQKVEEAFSSSFIKIPGRLDFVENPYTNIYVDYSHSDDSLRRAILTLKDLNFERIITVFGAGGDRDKTKRPRMGKVATELSDIAIITSDNPRTEDPDKIIEDIVKGAVNHNYMVESDRRKAIRKAVEMANKNDAVLIAGKGHEDYQILGNKVIHFSDFEEVKKALEEVKGKW